jgi:hypothetical protein
MGKCLEGTWEEFEVWIRETIGSDFRWLIRPQDSSVNREMIADSVLKDTKRVNGVFPGKNAFVEKA